MRAKAPDQRRVGVRHDEWLFTTLALRIGEPIDLPLAASPRLPGVDVKHSQGHGLKFAGRS
jgi:hypothetical protein